VEVSFPQVRCHAEVILTATSFVNVSKAAQYCHLSGASAPAELQTGRELSIISVNGVRAADGRRDSIASAARQANPVVVRRRMDV
jgi:hypothetical protein